MIKQIIIACDSFLALRNVRNANLGSRLKNEGYRVKVLVDPHQLEGSRAASVPDIEVEALLDFHIKSYPSLASILTMMELSRKSFKDPATFLSKLQYRLSQRRFAKFTVIPQFVRGWLLGLLRRYNSYREQATALLRKTDEYLQYFRMFSAERPALIAGLSPEGYREMALMQVAIDLGIPTAIMIRSRDNLVSKIAFLPAVDEFMVWSQQQHDYFRHLYPELNSHPVHIVGSPQFARHRNPAYRLSRDGFFEQLGLDPGRPLVTFCLENPSVVPHQGNMARALAMAFADDLIDHGAQLLIRNHPRAFGSDYDPLGGCSYERVKLYPLPTDIPMGHHDNNLVRLILEDEMMHLATMAYQDVNCNIMSTVILDSAILDKPIVNVAFDIPPDISKNITVKRFFKRTDYKLVEKSGANTRVNSLDELINTINEYLDNPSIKTKERAAFVRQEIGVPNEQSSTELESHLLRLAQLEK